jgi:hypothetical protein
MGTKANIGSEKYDTNIDSLALSRTYTPCELQQDRHWG